MRAGVVRMAIAGLVVPALASAQTVPLTEAEALARLGADSPRVQAARAGVEVVRADVQAAGRWPNPRLIVDREAVGGVAEHLVVVSQVLPITGRRGLAVSAASARVAASASRADEDVRRLRADLRLAFTGLWAAQTRERELARSHDRLRELAGVLANRETAGDAAGFDRLRVDREVIDADAARALAATDRAQAQARLTAFFASPSDAAALEAVRLERSRVVPPTVDDLMALAERTHGALAALGHDLEAAGFEERAAARSRVPEPEILAGTKTASAGVLDVGSVIGVHVTLPLFDRSGPERAAAQARAAQARAEAAALRQVLRAQIAAWRTAVVERRRVSDRYREAAAANTDALERIAQVRYDAGEHDVGDLIDAHHSAVSARLRQAELDAAVREAEIELEYVSGWGMP